MSRAAKQELAADAIVVPEKLLHEGEIVILAIKPSLWYVLLTSWPAVVLAAAIGAGGYLAHVGLSVNIYPEIILLLCAAMALTQLLIASCQWVGRLYILTNLRVLRVRGVFKPDVFHCPLRHIQEAAVLAGRTERLLSVGTLYFRTEPPVADEPGWLFVNQPNQVLEIVQEAIRRAKV